MTSRSAAFRRRPATHPPEGGTTSPSKSVWPTTSTTLRIGVAGSGDDGRSTMDDTSIVDRRSSIVGTGKQPLLTCTSWAAVLQVVLDQRDRLMHEDFVRGVERHFGHNIDTELTHCRSKALSAECVECCLTLPSVDVMAVVSLPPCNMRVATVGRSFEPASLGSDTVILLGRNTSEDNMSDNGQSSIGTTISSSPVTNSNPPAPRTRKWGASGRACRRTAGAADRR